jgi:hypothetical protein
MAGKRLALLTVVGCVPLAVMIHVLADQKPVAPPPTRGSQAALATSGTDSVPLAPTLRIAIQSLRPEQDQVKLVYTFEWIEKRDDQLMFGFTHCWGDLVVLYWDAAGKEIEEQSRISYLCPDFAAYRVRLHKGAAFISPPPRARWAAVGFHRGGIVSEKHLLSGQ